MTSNKLRQNQGRIRALCLTVLVLEIICSCEERFPLPAERYATPHYIIVGDTAVGSIEALNIEISDSFEIDLNKDGINDFLISTYWHSFNGMPGTVKYWILLPLAENNKVLCDALNRNGLLYIYQRYVNENDTLKVLDSWYLKPLNTVLLGWPGAKRGFTLFYIDSGYTPGPYEAKGSYTGNSTNNYQEYLGLINIFNGEITLGWIKVRFEENGKGGNLVMILEEIGSMKFPERDENLRINNLY